MRHIYGLPHRACCGGSQFIIDIELIRERVERQDIGYDNENNDAKIPVIEAFSAFSKFSIFY
jgi:hypothetical protein